MSSVDSQCYIVTGKKGKRYKKVIHRKKSAFITKFINSLNLPGLKTNYFLPLLYNEKLTQKRENIDDLQTKWNSKIQKLPKSKGNKKRGIKRCKICIRHLPTFSTYHFYMLMGPNVFWKLKGTKMELQQLNCMLLFIFRDVFLHWFTS